MKNKFIQILSMPVVLILSMCFSMVGCAGNNQVASNEYESILPIDIKGHGKVKWEMTIDEVLKSENIGFNKEIYFNQESLIKRDKVGFENNEYSLRYIFHPKTMKLKVVEVELLNQTNLASAYKSISKALFSKYGKPDPDSATSELYRMNKGGVVFEFAEFEWQDGENRIYLSYMNHDNRTGFLKINLKHVPYKSDKNMQIKYCNDMSSLAGSMAKSYYDGDIEKLGAIINGSKDEEAKKMYKIIHDSVVKLPKIDKSKSKEFQKMDEIAILDKYMKTVFDRCVNLNK